MQSVRYCDCRCREPAWRTAGRWESSAASSARARTCRIGLTMSVTGGRPEVVWRQPIYDAIDPNRTSWIGGPRDPSLTVLVRCRARIRGCIAAVNSFAKPTPSRLTSRPHARFPPLSRRTLSAFSPPLKNGLLRGWHRVPKPNQRYSNRTWKVKHRPGAMRDVRRSQPD